MRRLILALPVLLVASCTHKTAPPALKDIATPNGYTRVDHYSSAGKDGDGIPYLGSGFEATGDVLVVVQCYTTSGPTQTLSVGLEPDQEEKVGQAIRFAPLHGLGSARDVGAPVISCDRHLLTQRGTASAADLHGTTDSVRASVTALPVDGKAIDKRFVWSVDLFMKG